MTQIDATIVAKDGQTHSNYCLAPRMVRTSLLFLLASFLVTAALPSFAQDRTPPDNAAESSEPAAEPEPDEDSSEVIETDDESYLDIDDKDFTPSEDTSADQSLTFPTDI